LISFGVSTQTTEIIQYEKESLRYDP